MKQNSLAAHTPNKAGEWHPLKAHLGKVAYKAEIFANKFTAGIFAYYAGLWHDLGKYNPAFQQYLQQCAAASQSGDSEPRERVLHAIYGAKLAAEKFEPLAPLIFGHHAGLQNYGKLGDRLQEVNAATYQVILQNAISESLDLEIAPTEMQHMQQFLMGLFQDQHGYELLLRLLFSCLVDADYLDTETHFDLENAAKRGSLLTMSMLWQTLQMEQGKLLAMVEDTPVNGVRSQVYQACIDAARCEPGVFRLAQ